MTIAVFQIRFQQMYALKMFVLWDTHVIQKHVFVSLSESGHNHAFHEKQPKKKNPSYTQKKFLFTISCYINYSSYWLSKVWCVF